MDLSVSKISFNGSRMSHSQVNKIIKNNLTLPVDKKLPKDLERQLSPNFIQRLVQSIKKIFH